VEAIIWASYRIEEGVKNEKGGSVSSFPEIDKEEEEVRSHQSKIVSPSQSAAPHHLRDRKG
jgi:hypothetical protein